MSAATLLAPKQRMFRLVNAHRLGNARLVFVAGFYFPAFFQFDERQAVRRVAINFVRGSENKNRFGAKLPRGFEQVQRADGVHAKVRVRIARGPVVRRLRGRVDDERDVRAELFEKIFHGCAVADVEIVVLVIGKFADEFLAVAERRSLLAEKPLAQVVVNADDFVAFARKTFDAFRSD
jgi:hypothetical protein